MINNESDLSRWLMRQCPDIERMENSVKGGTPDMIVPTHYSWVPIELKIEHSMKVIFQNSQMSYMVRNSRLPRHLWSWVLVCRTKDETGVLFNSQEVLAMPKQPYSNGKSLVDLPADASFSKLQLLIDNLGIHRRL
jgi:hypothetical protein